MTPEDFARIVAQVKAERRLVLLVTSPRVAPGLLSAAAWQLLTELGAVRAAPGSPHEPHLREAGVEVVVEDERDPGALARRLLLAAADEGEAAWLVGPEGDEPLARALATLVEQGPVVEGTVPVLEVLPGSYDLPGARLIDLVATMDRLRSPGGCPWDAEQTHESLTTYLLEEAYETLEAIETGDRAHLREELGDLLLQVMFHSRIAAEHPDEPWTVDDVAADIVAKLVRRHPHVFGPGAARTTATAVEASWHTAKAAEKGRTSAVEGVPAALPALALAAKLMHRAESHGVTVDLPADDSVGSRLLRLVAEARAAGVDPEAALRGATRDFADRVRAAEQDDSAGG